ncbi:MAG: peptidoglycan DD-metalloendopeptidase family protein [bacterium]|nr:peptidoglycan DD-metalloendopeptidase family protein [bacterium]
MENTIVNNRYAGQKKTFPSLKMAAGFPEHILVGYAQVYFSRKWYVGIFFCAATFVIPAVGAAGLAGLLLSNLFAWLLGLSRKQINDGFFAYNGLLTALALGLFYRISLPFAAMLCIASFLGVLIAAGVRSLCDRYLFVPVLSTPFVLTTWIIIAAGEKFDGLIYATESFEVSLLSGLLPESAAFMVRSFGAAFFQLSVPSGILVACGILIFSRQGFMLAAGGLFIGAAFYSFLGGEQFDLHNQWIGFNFALTAIAVGGMFVVPGWRSFLLAFAAALLAAVISAAAAIVLAPLKLPPLAFPFIAATSIVIYALKNRVSPRFLETINFPQDSPEKNLERSRNKQVRFVFGDIPSFELPVSGEWSVSQGFNGKHTHQDLWAHAWDFEIPGSGGASLDDYSAWKKPVFAPGDGTVVRVINHIEDNTPGQVNLKDNWGNTIVLRHYGLVYSALSHLALNSISVKEGDSVKKGQPLALVGNSGRSPVPHLHFQVQYSPEPGAPTADSRLLHYLLREDDSRTWITSGVPAAGSRVMPVFSDSKFFDAASFPVGGKWSFSVFNGKKRWAETWETRIDFAGNRSLVCREKKTKVDFFVNKNFLLLLDYSGPSNSALEWFFLGLPRLPFSGNPLCWSDEIPAKKMMNPFLNILFDIIEPFYSPAAIVSSSRATNTPRRGRTPLNGFAVCSVLHLKPREITIETSFEFNKGLSSILVKKGDELIFEITQENTNGYS